ncbi:MAG: hypothetical protein JST26_11580 [Bacteroidetes bacterium]|nr:hypothetical protein [Bacteroidota bacterium]
MYKSPLHILSELGEEEINLSDSASLLRLRKKWLAEFELGNSVTIDIHGKPYTKDEIIKTIDVLMGNPQMPLHQFIFSHKNLLDFLEHDLSRVSAAELKKLDVPEALKHELSPLLLERLSYNLKKSFHTRNFDIAGESVSCADLLTESDRMEFYDQISKNLSNLDEHIQSVSRNQFQNITSEFAFLKRVSFADFLGKLPPEFMDSVNSLVSTIINTMVAYQRIKNHDRALLFYISNILCKIECDETLKSLVKSNHKIFQNNYDAGSGSSGDGLSTSRIFYLILMAIIFIARMATCSRNSSTYDFSNAPRITFTQPKAQSEYKDFEDYRKYRLQNQELHTSLPELNTPLAIDSSLSGDTPFRYILRNSSRYDYQDTSLKRVIVRNNTGHDLIITTFDYNSAKAYYFFKGRPDTLSFTSSDKISFYFGDTLAQFEKTSNIVNDLPLKNLFEVYFRHCDKKAYSLFEKDFVIDFKTTGKSKKTKKKKPLPTLDLNPEFIESGHYEDDKLIVHTNDQ